MNLRKAWISVCLIRRNVWSTQVVVGTFVQESRVAHLDDLIRTPHFNPRMWTANRVTRAEQEVPLCISELDDHRVPFILKSTPDVLTMGRRCMEDGYSFVWKAKSNQPHFRKPDGTRIYLTVEHYVPYLTTNLVGVAAAAPESGDDLLAETDDAGIKERVRGGRVESLAAERAGRDLIPACRDVLNGDVKTGVVGPGSGGFLSAGSVPALPVVGGSSSSSGGPVVVGGESHADVASEPDPEYYPADPFDVEDDVADGGVVIATRRDLKAEAGSLEHQLLHANKNPHCPQCLQALSQRKPNS